MAPVYACQAYLAATHFATQPANQNKSAGPPAWNSVDVDSARLPPNPQMLAKSNQPTATRATWSRLWKTPTASVAKTNQSIPARTRTGLTLPRSPMVEMTVVP